ncbi:unnamed protein product [Prorocentrum cordatum]|uniref:Reverse transcriptase domain-containing protein n=1 Tax=Prorocentrum cordatum TaxID=2364126 RepID=A0ABN9T1G5_9DINO|nr:unnamed protein product [Polarella glacialis]
MDNQVALRRLAAQRSEALRRHRNNPTAGAKRILRRHQKENKRAVRRMINEWWSRQADDVSSAAFPRDMAAVFSGTKLMSQQLGSLPKAPQPHFERGAAAHLDSMADHFARVLNITRPIDEAVVNGVLESVTPVMGVDWTPPCRADVFAALKQLKQRKAPGPDGVPAELYQVPRVANELADILTPHVRAWWGGDFSTRPAEWHESHMVALYKGKGELADLDNWRGICLLQPLSKVVAILVNKALRSLAEKVLDESQMEFRATAPLHGAPADDEGVYAIFVDLRKTFDSAPRELIWKILCRLGAPAGVVGLLEDMHAGMGSQVKFRGRLSRRFPMNTGVRQGAVGAPTLWDLYFHFVVLDWRRRARQELGRDIGVCVASKPDGHLRARARTLQTAEQRSLVTDLECADDLVGYATTFADLEVAARLLVDAVRDWGGEVNVQKTKWMCVRSEFAGEGTVPLELRIHDRVVEQVVTFSYLGSLLAPDNTLGQAPDVERRVQEACKSHGRLRGLWSDGRIHFSTKRTIFLAVVKTTLLWGAETWTLRRRELARLRRTWYGWIRDILGLTWQQCADLHISHAMLASRLGVEDIHVYAAQAGARWLGHVARMDPMRLPLQLLFGAVEGRGPSRTQAGRKGLRRTPAEQARNTVRGMGLSERTWSRDAQDREAWRKKVSAYRPRRGARPPPRDRVASANLTCSACGFQASSADGLTRHVDAKHQLHPPRPLQCETCGRTFKNRSSLARHAKTHEPVPAAPAAPPAPPPAPPPGQLRCSRCNATFNAKGHYNKHVSSGCPLRNVPVQHGDCRRDAQWRCPHCHQHFQRSTDFFRHYETRAQRPDRAGAPLPQRVAKRLIHQCAKCGRCFAFPSHRNRHQNRCRA